MVHVELRVDKKRKFDDPRRKEDPDDPLNLSLRYGPPIPTPSVSLPPPQESHRRQVYVLSTLNSPRIFRRPPPPPPSIPDYFQSCPSPNRASTLQSPQLPPLPTEIYRPLHPTETRNSPRIFSTPPPYYREFFPTATPNFPMLPPQPSSSQPPRLPGPSLSQESSGTEDGDPGLPRFWHIYSAQLPREVKSLEIEPPYLWATNRRATVHSIQHLLSIPINTITGYVHCKTCGLIYQMGFDLSHKAYEIFQLIIKYKSQMHDRAPGAWMNPASPPCRFCGKENSAKPIISDKKRAVNWLFLFLGQMLGSCPLNQLKYFCKHTNNHFPLAKDQVLYLTYMGVCKQLVPDGPFDL